MVDDNLEQLDLPMDITVRDFKALLDTLPQDYVLRVSTSGVDEYPSWVIVDHLKKVFCIAG